MNYLILPEYAAPLQSALLRFSRFILDGNLVSNTADNPESEAIENVLYLGEAKKDLNLVRFYRTHPELNYISMGYNPNSDLNLLDLHRLKRQFSKLLAHTKAPKPLFQKQELIKIVTQLYSTHGDQSILQGLIKSIYYLKNGFLMYKSGDLNWEDASEHFIKPGIEWWLRFNQRLTRYSDDVSLFGNDTEISKILQEVEYISEFTRVLDVSKPTMIDELKLEAIQQNLSRLENIHKSFCEIADNLGITVK